jgi:hypothetical protein
VDVGEDGGVGGVLCEGTDGADGKPRGVGELAKGVESVLVLDERVGPSSTDFDGFEPGRESFGSLRKCIRQSLHQG